jgi:hypothetical protein
MPAAAGEEDTHMPQVACQSSGRRVRRKIVRASCAVLATILLFVTTRRTIMYRDHDTEASF